MVSIKNFKRIATLRRVSQISTMVGLGALVGGFIAGFTGQLILQYLGLIFGLLLSQVAAYLTPTYVASPRPDEALDEALGKAVKQGRIYHHVLPVSHVLLTPAGPIILHTCHQGGDISVIKNKRGDDKWIQTRANIIRRIFGRESIGNPTRDAEIMIKRLAVFIRKNAPQIQDEELPIGVIILFTLKRPKNGSGFTLDLAEASFPAMHVSKLRGYLRAQGTGEPLRPDVYAALEEAFDAKAADLLDANGRPLAADR